jgi:hypothetical protein
MITYRIIIRDSSDEIIFAEGGQALDDHLKELVCNGFELHQLGVEIVSVK